MYVWPLVHERGKTRGEPRRGSQRDHWASGKRKIVGTLEKGCRMQQTWFSNDVIDVAGTISFVLKVNDSLGWSLNTERDAASPGLTRDDRKRVCSAHKVINSSQLVASYKRSQAVCDMLWKTHCVIRLFHILLKLSCKFIWLLYNGKYLTTCVLVFM